MPGGGETETIGIVYNPLSDSSVRFSMELMATLQQRGLNVWRGTSVEQRDTRLRIEDFDLLIALGGDGTVLRTARMAIPHNIPILTVAMGRLNFLAEMSPQDVAHGLDVVLAGGGWYDRRTLIDVSLKRGGEQLIACVALNEVVVSRGDISRIVAVDVMIDDIPLTTYRADGVLVATATGSTAYALSAGGPIVDPRSRALVLVPVAAHLTAVPAMVLHEDAVVSLAVRSCRHATLAVDGRKNVLLHEGDCVRIARSTNVCTFVRVYPQNQFYTSLIRRLRRE